MLEPKWGMSSQHQFKLTAIFPPGCSHGVPTVGVWKQIRPAGPGAQEPPRAAQRPLPIYICHSNFVELWTCAAQLDQKARHSLAHAPKLRSKSSRICLPSQVTNMDLMMQVKTLTTERCNGWSRHPQTWVSACFMPLDQNFDDLQLHEGTTAADAKAIR